MFGIQREISNNIRFIATNIHTVSDFSFKTIIFIYCQKWAGQKVTITKKKETNTRYSCHFHSFIYLFFFLSFPFDPIQTRTTTNVHQIFTFQNVTFIRTNKQKKRQKMNNNINLNRIRCSVSAVSTVLGVSLDHVQ